MSEEKLVPKLRFSGFDDEWIIKKLNDVSDVNPKTRELPEKFVYIDLDSVNHGILTKFNQITKNEAPSRAQRCLNVNDILFQTVRPYQMNNLFFELYDGEYVASTGYAQIKSKIVPKFLYYYLHYNKFVNEVLNCCTGTSYPAINSNDLKKIKIKIPSSSNEQRLIGDLFYKLDQKIELLKDKYNYYQDFKKFLMQQIFTQKLRFADIDSGWKEISLKDIGTFYRGHSYNSTNVADEGLLVLRSNNIRGNVLDFSEDGLQFVDKDCKKELELQKNDIVICMSNGTRRLVGKSAEYTGNYENKVTVGAFCSIFRTENKLAKYLFQTESYKKNLYLILAGTNINNLKNSDLEKFKFNIPTNESEINKIHDLFVSIDNKIDYNKKQLEEITLFKKGLLQQMFV